MSTGARGYGFWTVKRETATWLPSPPTKRPTCPMVSVSSVPGGDFGAVHQQAQRVADGATVSSLGRCQG